jgi:hypothetical protein
LAASASATLRSASISDLRFSLGSYSLRGSSNDRSNRKRLGVERAEDMAGAAERGR